MTKRGKDTPAQKAARQRTWRNENKAWLKEHTTFQSAEALLTALRKGEVKIVKTTEGTNHD